MAEEEPIELCTSARIKLILIAILIILITWMAFLSRAYDGIEYIVAWIITLGSGVVIILALPIKSKEN